MLRTTFTTRPHDFPKTEVSNASSSGADRIAAQLVFLDRNWTNPPTSSAPINSYGRVLKNTAEHSWYRSPHAKRSVQWANIARVIQDAAAA
jgi:hypothetical protein